MGPIMGLLTCLLLLITTCAALADEPVRGMVYLPDGTPAPDARVWASPISLEPLPVVHGVTDANGAFSLELSDGRWFIFASKGTMGGTATDTSRTIQVRSGERVSAQNIQMVERGTLRGRVTDEATSEPIAGARLFLDDGEVLVTDEAGCYEVGGSALGSHSLYAVADGYERTRVLYDTMNRPGARLDIALRPGGLLKGTILDQTGRVIPGAYACKSTSGNMLSSRGLIAMCDENGRYVFDGLALDVTNTISFWAQGYETDETHNSVFLPSTHPHDELNIVLAKAQKERAAGSDDPVAPIPAIFKRRDLTGTVIGPDDQPLAGAEVRWGATACETIDRSVRTDRTGRFTLPDVPDRAGYITVMPEYFAPRFVPVPPGSNPIPPIGLQPGSRVIGRIVNEAGAPLTDVYVIPLVASPDPSLCNPLWLNERQTHSDQEGRFEINALPDGCKFDFLRAGFSDKRDQMLVPGDQVNTVVMSSTGAVSGRVVDAEGRPIESFRILLNIPPDYQPGEKVGGFFAGFEWPGVSFTDPAGRFLVSDLPAGSVVRVSVWAPGHGMASIDRTVVKPSDQLTDEDTIILQAGPPHELLVRLVAGGKPIAGGIVAMLWDSPNGGDRFDWVYGMRTWRPTLLQRTDKDGVARWPAQPMDQAMIAIDCEGYARKRIKWRAGEDEIEVRLEPESVVEGTATDRDGKVVLQGFVILSNETGDHYSITLRPEDRGRFRFDRLAAGDYTYLLQYDRQTIDQRQITLGPGQTLSIDPQPTVD
ncbi:MAG: carboxypeptidase-like regulatory domain-containing protein [Phycisphaerales bacterium]